MNKLSKIFINIKNNINKRKLIVTAFIVSVLVFAYCILNYNKLVAVYNLQKDIEKKVESMDIVLGGNTVGIKLLATGVLVVGVDRDDDLIKIGDIILEVNKTKIESNDELIKFVNESNGNSLDLKINRQGKEFNVQELVL